MHDLLLSKKISVTAVAAALADAMLMLALPVSDVFMTVQEPSTPLILVEYMGRDWLTTPAVGRRSSSIPSDC